MADAREAPRELLALACATRPDWDREAAWQALHAAHDAGWDWGRTLKRAVALMLREDGDPRELRDEARGTRPSGPTGADVYARGGQLWRELYENRKTGPQPVLPERDPRT